MNKITLVNMGLYDNKQSIILTNLVEKLIDTTNLLISNLISTDDFTFSNSNSYNYYSIGSGNNYCAHYINTQGNNLQYHYHYSNSIYYSWIMYDNNLKKNLAFVNKLNQMPSKIIDKTN